MLNTLKKISSKTIIRFIRFYQRFISPLSPPRCRFYPTCSQYALEAVQLHGAGKGSWLGFKRICRCHPWGGSGVDFVPLPPFSKRQFLFISAEKAKLTLKRQIPYR